MHIMSSNELEEGLKKPLNNKSSNLQFPNLKFSIKSFLSHHPPTHRTILFTVVLFQVFLFLYFTRTTNLSPSESPQPLQEFQAQPLQKSQAQPLQEFQAQPLQKSQAQPLQEFQAQPLQKSQAQPLQESQAQPLQEFQAQPLEEFQAGGFESPQPLQEFQEFQAGGFESPQPLQEFQASGCDTRWIYVYDLPPMFNSKLANNCNQIDPWHNKCDKFLNDGFGLPAKELDGIVPESTLPAWYWTDHFWGEVLYHYRMLNYKCRTLEPESATAFYIPFYAGLAVVKYLWGNHTGRERDWHAEMLSKWLQEQKWWKRSNGSDHFLMLGRMTWDFRRLRDAESHWGSSFLNMPVMRNVIRLTVERNVWDDRDIAVPYPTIFHPKSESDIIEWQRFVRSRSRNYQFTYVGGARKSFKNDFRGILQNQCLNEPTACRNVDCTRENCLDGTTSIMSAFLDSDFCLQPRGDTFTRRSVFDCMLAGSIPVFFWRRTAYLQYKWFVPDEPESYSVFIHRDNVRNGTHIRRVLQGYDREEVERMREKVIEFIPRFVYAKASQGLMKTRDAFEIAIDGVLSKIQG